MSQTKILVEEQEEEEEEEQKDVQEEQEEDTVVAEYDVYITPELDNQLYLLQYPNRSSTKAYNIVTKEAPTHMRVKRESGFVELDIPMPVAAKFDKTKGLAWGDSLRQAEEGGTNAFGLSSGFGKGVRTKELLSADKAPLSETKIRNMLHDFDQSVQQGLVMHKTTLGGQLIRSEEGRPKYMLGTFRGTELHLSSLNGIVQMRPQFHYIDAKARQERDRSATESLRLNEPRMVQQIAKQATDDGEVNTERIASYLGTTSEEVWLPLDYKHENTEESWNAFQDCLFVKSTEEATKLASPMDNNDYLDAISCRESRPVGKPRKKSSTKKKSQILHQRSSSS